MSTAVRGGPGVGGRMRILGDTVDHILKNHDTAHILDDTRDETRTPLVVQVEPYEPVNQEFLRLRHERLELDFRHLDVASAADIPEARGATELVVGQYVSCRLARRCCATVPGNIAVGLPADQVWERLRRVDTKHSTYMLGSGSGMMVVIVVFVANGQGHEFAQIMVLLLVVDKGLELFGTFFCPVIVLDRVLVRPVIGTAVTEANDTKTRGRLGHSLWIFISRLQKSAQRNVP
ncbi:uncharacterized protein HMPREF1120_00588 [Exophiala dermatitidis NIH/UT8656]|uniref:Uncharacterized protein n=1 Tax=Exophiala dermatitidis (strain ATCC 34100 / CBS 525.76 / NIH/UT8656) TaxID=858893 RepID=H6BNJ7_EXODN|nr:uncharacterized protein HMPREF1120_00588 [Exophiala dermatitidis NIH/UT8656]EHY52374.1 hypothetical protein HMPREF1120_00588 [Exophiala dermatitidis NIH/UT8656]